MKGLFCGEVASVDLGVLVVGMWSACGCGILLPRWRFLFLGTIIIASSSDDWLPDFFKDLLCVVLPGLLWAELSWEELSNEPVLEILSLG